MKVNIGTDIGKKKCDYCIIDSERKILDRGVYLNKPTAVAEFVNKMTHNYAKDECRAACETTANVWRTTYAAFETAGIEIQLGNTSKMRYISVTGKKTDKIDAEKIAQLLQMDMIPRCHVPSAHVRMMRHGTPENNDGARQDQDDKPHSQPA